LNYPLFRKEITASGAAVFLLDLEFMTGVETVDAVAIVTRWVG
jgi:hypothetical protein